MADLNSFAPFRQFDEETMKEVVREGEIYLQAQFTAAAASDQRGMAWAGFMIASAAAALAGAAALVDKGGHTFLAVVTFAFSAALVVSTALAASAVRPRKFCFPGNAPNNWLPDNWMGHGIDPVNVQQARIEQAVTLQNQIESNSRWAEDAGKHLQLSLDVAMAAVVLAGCAVIVRSIFGSI